MNAIHADTIIRDLRDRVIHHRATQRERFMKALWGQKLTLRAVEKLTQDARDSYTIHWLERVDRACRAVEQ